MAKRSDSFEAKYKEMSGASRLFDISVDKCNAALWQMLQMILQHFQFNSYLKCHAATFCIIVLNNPSCN